MSFMSILLLAKVQLKSNGGAMRDNLGYTTISSIAGLSVAFILVDFFILKSALKDSKFDRRFSLLVPVAFLRLALFVVVANNR